MSEQPPKLYDLMARADSRRDDIREHVMEGIQQSFNIENDKYKMEVIGFEPRPVVYSPTEQKRAIMEGKTLTEPLKGVVTLTDKRTGKVIETATKTLVHIPYLTERHTFIVGGNDYSISNQVRIKPGVYTRERDNGMLEASFNLAKGKNFRLSMDPEKGVFYMEYATSKLPLYPILTGLGVQDSRIQQMWGKELADLNKQFSLGKEDRVIKGLYDRIVSPYAKTKSPTKQEMTAAIQATYDKTVLDPGVTNMTLGITMTSVNPEGLLRASQKLLHVFNGKEEQDDRDSTAFKTLHTAETFMRERIEKDAMRELKMKAGTKLRRAGDAPTISGILPSAPFTKSIHSFITTSALAATPMQINPMEIIDSSVKVTSLGEGGISSMLAVPDEARDVHHSHLGVLDPVRTPESGKAGVDIRAALHTKRDAAGNLYSTLRNMRTNKIEHLRADQLAGKVIAFPEQDLGGKKKISVMKNGKVQSVSLSEVDYAIPAAAYMYSPTTNMVPFLNSAQGNRNIMGAKFQTQALPLKDREAPFVQVRDWMNDTSVEAQMAKLVVPTAPVDGVVEKVDDDFVYIRRAPTKTAAPAARSAKDDDPDLIKVPRSNYFPLMSKTYLHDDIKVKAGDKVTRGQMLGDSNFTQDGTMALGKNLIVAYMPYYGYNSNDAVVISESAAIKLTSLHMYKESIALDSATAVHKNRHMVNFGAKYSKSQYSKMDDSGVVTKGAKVQPGDILIAGIQKNAPSAKAQMLGNLHKSLVKPFRDAAVTWDHDHEGEVMDVAVTPSQIMVTVKTEEPIQVGDKIAGRAGNKGVVSKIVPDSQMVKDEKGRPIDVLMTSAGIISRINPSQILETSLGKIVEKTGKPIQMEQFKDQDNVQWVKDQMKAHGVKDKETVFDPVSGKHIPNIHVGRQFTMKMFKSTDTNFAARGIGPGYDANLQPSKGGEEGAKSIAKMEFNALLAHNARNILHETAMVKGQRNDEYWRKVQLGLPAQAPTTNFAYDKFQHTLAGAGINVKKVGSQLTLTPLTDRDIDAMAPRAITNSLLVKPHNVKGVNQIAPEKGGLFDPVITGGLDGSRYSKIELFEPVVNPIFEDPARYLLGMSAKDFRKLRDEKGAGEIRERLNKIDLAQYERELSQQVNKLSGTPLNTAVKQLKYAKALRKQNMRAGDAYVLSKVPVTPPIVRPITPNADGTTLVADANYLYRDLMLANESMGAIPDELRTPEEMGKQRQHMHDAVGALFGTNDPVSPQNQGRGVKGHLVQITGSGSPKTGYFHSKLLRRRQDLSARGTIAPDHTLELDQIGLPEEMGWKMYEPFIVKNLVKNGISAVDARKHVKDKTQAARNALDLEVMSRPVIVNRAPTLHRFNMVSAYPVLVPGKTVRLNPFAESGMNADYDGDAVQLHVPVGDMAVREAQAMTLSNLIFGDRSKDDLMIFPAHEALIGTYMATSGQASGAARTFKTKEEAMAAYRKGEIKLTTPVKITG